MKTVTNRMIKKVLAIVLILSLFSPVFAQKSEKAVVPVAQEQSITIAVKNKNMTIQNVKTGDKIEILNILGVKVIEKRTDSTTFEMLLDLPQGYYIVKVGSLVRKISLK